MREKVFGYAFSWVGCVAGYLKPTFPFVLVCVLAVCVDCYSAWSLSRRVAKCYPGAADGGKFSSRKALGVFNSLMKIAMLVVLMYVVDTVLFPSHSLMLANITAGSFCFAQVWSVLENESSCNGAAWAKALQRIMVDKTERHLGVKVGDIFGAETQDKDNNKE